MKKVTLIVCLILLISILGVGVIASASGWGFAVPVEFESTDTPRNEILSLIDSLYFSYGEVGDLIEYYDAYGNKQVSCRDDRYIYTFDADNHLISARICDELIDSCIFNQSGKVVNYEDVLEKCMASCLTAFDPKTTSVRVEQSDYEIDLILNDRRGDCLVNTGAVDMTNDGVLLYVGGTCNSISDFSKENIIRRDEAIEIVVNALFSYKEYIEQNGLPVDMDYEADPPDMVQPDIMDETEESAMVPTPEFKLLFDSAEDISILLCEKQIENKRVIWVVQAKVDTSWGELDPMLNFIYEYRVDATSGEILEINTFTSD